MNRNLVPTLVLAAASGWHVRIQEPIALGDGVPEPDVILARGGRRDYRLGHPGPADIGLVVEVSDTSLAYDRDVKVPLYTRAGIPEAWLFDVLGESITRYADPVDGAHRLVENRRFSDRALLVRREHDAEAALPDLR